MPAARVGVRETTLGAELGLDRVAMRKRRGALSQGKDWWKDSATIVWSKEAADELREALGAVPQDEPEPDDEEETSETESVTLIVSKIAKNDKFVVCYLGDKPIPVRVKRGTAGRLLGKPIRVVRDSEGNWMHAR